MPTDKPVPPTCAGNDPDRLPELAAAAWAVGDAMEKYEAAFAAALAGRARDPVYAAEVRYLQAGARFWRHQAGHWKQLHARLTKRRG